MPIVVGSGSGKTFGSITQEILSDVRGFTASSDQVTNLTAPMITTDLTGVVADSNMVSAGIIEVDDELMWVKTVDQTSGTFTLLPGGRGWNGSPVAAHSNGATVAVSPAYPRYRVKNAINDSIQSLFPLIFAATTNEFVYTNAIQQEWGVPADVEFILDVRYLDRLNNWQRIRRWELDRNMDTTSFPTGIALRMTQSIPYGVTIQVVYGRRPTPLSVDTDSFSTTGYDDRIADLVVLDVLARLLPMLDVARLQVTHVAADELQQARPMGTAVTFGDKFRQQYTQRLAIERAALNLKYPARVHLTR